MKIRNSDMLKKNNKSQKLNTPMNLMLFSKIKTNDEYKLFWKALNFINQNALILNTAVTPNWILLQCFTIGLIGYYFGLLIF